MNRGALGSARDEPAHAQPNIAVSVAAPNEAVEVTLHELLALNRKAEQLSLNALNIRSMMSGAYRSRVKGRGMEFDEVRLYAPGDDVRCLDWRVTARTGKVHTKLFREERERPIFVATDYRSTMFFATRGIFKSVLAAKLAALIAWIGNQHSDRVGGQIFMDQRIIEVKPRRGKPAILHFLNQLAELSSILRLESGAPEFAHAPHIPPPEDSLEAALERLERHARPGNLIFLLSDFRGLNAKSEARLARLGRHGEVVFVLIYDPLERRLPDRGRLRFSNGLKRISIDLGGRAFREQYQERFRERSERLRQLARKRGLQCLFCATTDEPLDVLNGLFTGRSGLVPSE